MRAGRMKHRLKIYNRTELSNEFGEVQQGERLFRVVHAEVVKLSGRRLEEVGEHFADYTAVYNVRDRNNVEDGGIVEDYRTGTRYRVAHAERNYDRGMVTLYCEKINL